VEAVVEAVRASRLVTLTGPGGTGKTRLSLQAAAEVSDAFADGVWFIALAPIREPDLVTPTVASTLGLQPSSEDPDQRLIEYLRGKEMLLVLDNFEQVLEAAGRVGSWLQGSPYLKVLVSSRIPLRIVGEVEYPVPPLPLPHPDDLVTPEMLGGYESVQLFAERAQAVRPDFQLTSDNARHVAAIVSRLDGLPLAIELAAARVKVLSPAALNERLTSRLSLLTGGARDLPARQQTLRGAIEWSYDLLEPPQRMLFDCLGVFGGSFGLAQSEAICGPDVAVDVLDGLISLVDQSLLRPLPRDDEPRFVMLETIGELAREHLADTEVGASIKERHARTYLALVEEAAKHFTRVGQREWLDRVALDHDNIRLALDWARSRRDADMSFRFVSALWRFWQMRGWLQEGRRLVEQALALEGGSPSLRRDALEAGGGLAYWQADQSATLGYYREALELAGEVGDLARLADCLYNYSVPVGVYLDPEEGRRLLGRALEIAVKLGDRERIGTFEWGIGSVYFLSSDPDLSLSHYERALEYLEGTDAIYQIGWAHRMIGTNLLYLNRAEEAEGHLHRGLEIFAEAGDTSAFALHIRDFAELALAQNDPEKALRLAGATSVLETVSETRMLDFVVNRLRSLESAIAAVGEEEAEKLLAEGRAMSVQEVLELVGHRSGIGGDS
jgi:predicted ATPase